MDSFYGYYRLLTSREGKKELSRVARESHRKRNQLLPHSPAARSVSESGPRGNSEAQAGAPRLVPAHLERRLFHRPGAVHPGHDGLRRAGLLLPAQSAPFRDAHAQAADPSALEGGDSGLGHQLLRAAHRSAGHSTESQMENVDYTCRLRYFEKAGDKYTVKAALKSLVQFDFHNLKTEYLPQRNDVIFCRNVMIYFDEAEQKRLIDKYHRCLNDDGYLFVGHAESLFGLTTKFHMIHQNNATVYQKIEGAV
jgi:hypothetical protein